MTAASEERLKTLQMIQEQKITVEDEARLLAALREGDRQTWSKVSINLPPAGMGAGANITSVLVPNPDSDDAGARHTETAGEEGREHLKVFVV
jgi:hypothetical protein